jgi:hypothetical protein
MCLKIQNKLLKYKMQNKKKVLKYIAVKQRIFDK